MKKFIAIEAARPLKGRYEYKIYQIVKNDLQYIGLGDFTYQSTRGPESEVMNKLIELGELKQQKEKYYISSQPNKFKISYIVPLNQK